MNTNELKMIGLQFTSLATKQGRVDMKIRRRASQQNDASLWCQATTLSPGVWEGNQIAFYLPGKRRGADECKMMRRGSEEGENDRELGRVRDNDERAFLAPRRQ